METELYWRLYAIVLGRGLPIGNVGRYVLVATWDGGALWDAATQGPVPTLTQLQAVTAIQITAAKTAVREQQALRLADDVVARSVARVAWGELKKCQVRTGQTLLDWPQFRNAIKAEILARLNGGT